MKKILFILLSLAMTHFSCQKEISSQLSNSDTLPVVVTNSITSIADSTATGEGEVISDGGSTVIARGLCWGTTQNPSLSDNHSTNGTGTGLFVHTMTGLSPSTQYHIRAYATNSAGTAYGADSVFTTSSSSAILPTISTTTATLITATTASSGGNILSDGGATITTRGICWDTLPNPDITGNHSTDGTGTGTFVSAIAGLTPSTTYHIRAYATNTAGTAYGADSTFTTAPRDVYVAGYEDNSSSRSAILWKNGVATVLGTNIGIAKSVYVAGNDVYVGGSEIINNGPAGAVRYAILWKNGVATTLGIDFSEVYAVFVSGSDVYAAGYESVGTANAATLWKNGIATHLSNGINNAVATAVFIEGPDVYIAGSDDSGSKLWKNGIATPINGVDAPNAIYVSGNDIYIAGHSNNGTQDIAVIWKNGVSTNLTNGNNYADAKSVFVAGTDVYVTGFETTGPPMNDIVAKIWKNGTPIILNSTDAQGNAITVSDEVVYVAGNSNITSTGIGKLWKNGLATDLSNGVNNAEALSVFVK